MSNLTGFNVGANQRGILNLGSTINTPLSATLQSVTDGMGNASPLRLSTTEVAILSNSFLGASSATTNVVTLQSTTRNQIKIPSGTTMEFWYSAALEGMRLTSSGNLVVGTTTASARLHVRGDGTNPIARFENSSGSSAWAITATGSALTCESQARIQGPAIANDSSVVLGSFNNLTTTTLTQAILTTQGNIVCAAGSGNKRISAIEYSINNSGAQTGTATGIFLNATETALNGMGHNLMDLQVGGVSRFRVDNSWTFLNGVIGATILAGRVLAFGSNSGNTVITGTGNPSGSASSITIRVGDGNSIYKFRGDGLVEWGGATNAFPALKRSGTALEVRLADDSDFSSLWASSIRSKLFQANNGNNNGRVSLQTWNNMILNVEDGGVAIASGSFLSPNASAILQADSTTKGFLLPRMTEAQRLAISSPAVGLMVYQTDGTDGLYVYKAGGWTLII